MIYYSLIHPHLTYCITTWGGAPKSTLDSIIKLQKKSIRIISNSAYDSHTAPIFANLKILNLNNLYNLNLAISLHKIINKKTIGSDLFLNISNLHNYNTRLSSTHNFYQHFIRTNSAQSTFTTNGIKFWRKIPKEIKVLPLNIFKTRVKNFIFDIL